jgi:hypothetical protein
MKPIIIVIIISDIKEITMGWTCRSSGKYNKCLRNFGKQSFERLGRLWEENIKMDLEETRFEDVNGIELAQGRAQ